MQWAILNETRRGATKELHLQRRIGHWRSRVGVTGRDTLCRLVVHARSLFPEEKQSAKRK